MSFISDYITKKEAQIRKDNAESTAELNSIYSSYKKGFSTDGNRRHIADIAPYWFVADPRLKMYTKLLLEDDERGAMKYMRAFLADHEECRIKTDNKSNLWRFDGGGKIEG